MLFADLTLVHRIERAECRLTTDVAHLIQERSSSHGVFVASIAGGMAVHVGDEAPFNKVIGLGLEGPFDEAARKDLEAIEREFDARHAPLQVELATLADGSFARSLTARGYTLVGFENVLGQRLDEALTARLSANPTPPDLSIVRGSGPDSSAWVDIVTEGFAQPDAVPGGESHESFPRDALSQTMRDMTQVTGFGHYLASLEGSVVGGAGLRTSEGVAQLCGSATLPASRRRGVQSALLARRLLDAQRMGCDVAVITTQPGSKSQQNAQRHGFALLYSRAILVREPRSEGLSTGSP